MLLKTMTPRGPRSPAIRRTPRFARLSILSFVGGRSNLARFSECGQSPAWRGCALFPNPTAALSFHPLVVNNQVLIADAQAVTSFDLFTGKQLFRFQVPAGALQDGKTHGVAGARYTLTAWNNLVFARLGSQTIGPDNVAASSELVCLALADLPLTHDAQAWRPALASQGRRPG